MGRVRTIGGYAVLRCLFVSFLGVFSLGNCDADSLQYIITIVTMASYYLPTFIRS